MDSADNDNKNETQKRIDKMGRELQQLTEQGKKMASEYQRVISTLTEENTELREQLHTAHEHIREFEAINAKLDLRLTNLERGGLRHLQSFPTFSPVSIEEEPKIRVHVDKATGEIYRL